MGAAALAASLGGAGCGDEQPSRAAFARDADAVCTPSLVQQRRIEQRLGVAATGADPDAVFARSAALIRQEARISGAAFDRIDALDKPSDGRGAVSAWVAANRRQVTLTRALADAFAAHDETRIAQLSEQVDKLDDATTATARKLGMRACAERVDAAPGR